MGYFIKNIAKESKSPARVSMADNPNFIEFEAYTTGQPQKVDISLRVKDTAIDSEKTKVGITRIVDNNEGSSEANEGTRYEFAGTRDKNKVNDKTFYLHDTDKAITTENLKECLMAIDFFRSNFEITNLPVKGETGYVNGDTISIVSKGAGPQYALDIEVDEDFIEESGSGPGSTSSSDSIDQGRGDCSIELQMYGNTGIFMGVDALEGGNLTMGSYATTLVKSYSGNPIWFDVNALSANSKTFSSDFITAESWCDTGTVTDYRFIARRSDGANHEPFYVSDVFYALTGYDRTLEINDLSEYIYDTGQGNLVKPLTRQPVLPHVKGQSQYFNFIFSDPRRNEDLGSKEYNMGIRYNLYSQSKKYLGTVYLREHDRNRKLFNIVNTIRLDLDKVMESYDNVGIVEACLHRADDQISEPLVFRVLPESLYRVNDFAFLNSLGGWSSFNFCGIEQTDFKTSANTIYKTQLPHYSVRDEIESVFGKEVTEQFVVQTMPIRRELADWLKEMSASPVVYELSTERYVVIDEMNIKHNSTDDLFRVDMKYHYSDSFNTQIKQ